MKRISILLPVIGFIAITSAYAQSTESRLISDHGNQRLTALQSTMLMNNEEESVFWPIYHEYEQQRQLNTSCTFFFLSFENIDAESCVDGMFKSLGENLSLRRQYFDKISSALNGTLALQFLQSEALLDLIVKSQLYDNDSWPHPQWQPEMLENDQMKMSVMEKNLDLTREQVLRFRSLFVDFEFNYSRIVGHELVWFEQYVEDITDLTPAQCKKLGKEFLNMQQNELRLREKVFKEMKGEFGEHVALRYLAFEDFFNASAKLKTWDTAFLASR